MTDEKKKPEEDEVTDEQLGDVAGGIMKNKHDTAKNSIALNSDITGSGQAEDIAGSSQGGGDR